MLIIDVLKAESLTARKKKDKFTAGIMTTLIAEIEMVGKNDGNRVTTDTESIKVIQKFKKGANENLELLRDGGESAMEPLINEIAIYDAYLPKLLSKEELQKILQDWMDDNYIDSPSIGGYMGALGRVHKGLYDGKMANGLIRELLK